MTTMNKTPKTLNKLENHAINRFRERYKRYLSHTDYLAACKAIHKQVTVQGCSPVACVYKQSNTRTHWLIKIGDLLTIAVYDKPRKGIATFMPIHWRKSSWSIPKVEGV